IRPQGSHLERFRFVGGFGLPERAVRVWVPKDKPSHHLYVQDGQNLFDPKAMWGGWRLQDAAGHSTLVIGVDNSGQGRFDEYTHTQDRVGGTLVGGKADAYADLLVRTVRGLVETNYGPARKVGVLGSSLGGLAAFHAAQRHPNSFDFVGAMSATFGWGQMAEGVKNPSMIDRFKEQPRLRRPKFYIDSGGAPGGGDNYDVTQQMAGVLADSGYRWNKDLWHWHEPNAPHSEAAWAARVNRPLRLFEAM
ncbi:unnamed protein product, partial [Laminaria digitata]